jgi:hypothetical protein
MSARFVLTYLPHSLSGLGSLTARHDARAIAFNKLASQSGVSWREWLPGDM